MSTTGMTTDAWIDTREAARILGVAEVTLRLWRSQRNPAAPPFVRVGSRSVRYCPKALAVWAASRQCKPAKSVPQKSHDPGDRKGRRGRVDR